MWLERYPALYRDNIGEVATTIENDGKELRMELRGIKFTGNCLDDWATDVDMSQLQSFTFHHNKLCNYQLELSMPLQIVYLNEQIEGTLCIHLILGQPAANGGVDREELHLALTVANFSFVSKGKDGYFETELLDIHEQLPEGMYMKTCLFCTFSRYHPVGNGLFGGLTCFKRAKQVLLATKNKRDLLMLYEQNVHEYVQETYCCSEFMRNSFTFKKDKSGLFTGQI